MEGTLGKYKRKGRRRRRRRLMAAIQALVLTTPNRAGCMHFCRLILFPPRASVRFLGWPCPCFGPACVFSGGPMFHTDQRAFPRAGLPSVPARLRFPRTAPPKKKHADPKQKNSPPRKGMLSASENNATPSTRTLARRKNSTTRENARRPET